jgi:hypothetical protein
MIDRTTKLLLTLIALALCGLLFRPALTVAPARAADAAPVITGPSSRFAAPVMKIITTGQVTRAVYAIDNAGWVYLLGPSTLEIKRNVRLIPKP